MARTIIEFPDQSHFSTDYTVLIADINSADHLGADRLFSILIEAQMRFIYSLGYPDRHRIAGSRYIVADTEFVFRSESKHGDALKIDIAVANFSAKGFELLFRFYNSTRDQLAALAKVGVVFVDYETGRAQAVPDEFRARFES